MSLYIQGMSSCAIQEIASIGDNNLPPAGVMRAFCTKTLGTRGDCTPNGGYAYRSNTGHGHYTEGLGETYVFHGVECYGKKDPTQRAYAGKLADFIKAKKLGSIHEGDLVSNHRYHSDHFTRSFIWNVDREAVMTWWANQQPKPAPPITLPELPSPVPAIPHEVPF